MKFVPSAIQYNGKIQVFGTPEPGTKKRERQVCFRNLCQRVCDNLSAGQVGYVRDFDGGIYGISRDKRSAARLAENDETPDVVALRAAK